MDQILEVLPLQEVQSCLHLSLASLIFLRSRKCQKIWELAGAVRPFMPQIPPQLRGSLKAFRRIGSLSMIWLALCEKASENKSKRKEKLQWIAELARC